MGERQWGGARDDGGETVRERLKKGFKGKDLE